MLLCYHSRSENLKGIPKKVELVGAVTEFFRRYLEGIVQRRRGRGGGVFCNK